MAKLILIRSICSGVGLATSYLSLHYITIGINSLLMNLSSIIVILVSGVLLGELIRSYEYICVVIAFLGTALISNSSFSGESENMI